MTQEGVWRKRGILENPHSGEFLMGITQARGDQSFDRGEMYMPEAPQYKVKPSGQWMDRYPAMAGRVGMFFYAGGYHTTAEKKDSERGLDGRLYRWGNEAPDAKRGNCDYLMKESLRENGDFEGKWAAAAHMLVCWARRKLRVANIFIQNCSLSGTKKSTPDI